MRQKNDQAARIPVSERPSKGCRDHVKAEKRAGEVSDLRIADVKLVLHQRLHRK
jgi:hypothetical protein